jgi:hypothetical protein
MRAHPDAAWAHLWRGEVYFRRFWRRDAAREWDAALRLDSSLRHDPRLLDHLCVALGPKWHGAGERLVTEHLGQDAIPSLRACLAGAEDPSRQEAATRLLEQLDPGAAR